VEGGMEKADVIKALVSAGIPVMAHCGLRPQSIRQMGGYRVQRDEIQLLADAQAAEEAGAFAIVLECIPADIAARITETLKIPTIGIGSGPGCDGQILVFHDLLGLTPGRVPKHVKAYADLKNVVAQAVTQYRDEVRLRDFPGREHSF
jgi:3-methyl-2-oxobutanoate hydroxymethyltransferase